MNKVLLGIQHALSVPDNVWKFLGYISLPALFVVLVLLVTAPMRDEKKEKFSWSKLCLQSKIFFGVMYSVGAGGVVCGIVAMWQQANQ